MCGPARGKKTTFTSLRLHCNTPKKISHHMEIAAILVENFTLKTLIQRHRVYSAAYGTVHYKELLKSSNIHIENMKCVAEATPLLRQFLTVLQFYHRNASSFTRGIPCHLLVHMFLIITTKTCNTNYNLS